MMRRIFRTYLPHDERTALIADALGALALFVLLLVALHLPVFA